MRSSSSEAIYNHLSEPDLLLTTNERRYTAFSLSKAKGVVGIGGERASMASWLSIEGDDEVQRSVLCPSILAATQLAEISES